MIMFARNFSAGEPFSCAGNQYVMLVPRDVTDCCEAVLEKIRSGEETPPNAHATFNQLYILMAGEASVTIGNETRRLVAPAVAYVPANTSHFVANTGQDELRYVYITMWPGGIPPEEKEGGWRKACTDMIEEYASRGYPAEPAGE